MASTYDLHVIKTTKLYDEVYWNIERQWGVSNANQPNTNIRKKKLQDPTIEWEGERIHSINLKIKVRW